MFDTGAQRTMVNSKFALKHKIKIRPTNFTHARLANGYKAPIKGESNPFQIKMQTLNTTIKGLVMDNLNHNIVAGMDWFARANPSICWKTKTMTINQNGVNHKITKDPIDLIMRDTIFCQVINTDDSVTLTENSNLTFLKYSSTNDAGTFLQGIETDKLNQILKDYANIV